MNRISRRQFMKATAGAAAALAAGAVGCSPRPGPASQAAAPAVGASPRRPNVLIITTHDSGRHFGCYGAATAQTPRIDELAATGVRFSQMYAASPICSPSRGALLTGRYPLANGLVGLAGGSWNWELNDYRQHLSSVLRAAGYHTAMFGLQHETKFIARMGFNDVSAHGVAGKAKVTAPQVAQKVADFLRTRRAGDSPFYAQVGFHETHTPYDFGGCKSDSEKGTWIPPYAQRHAWPAWKAILARFGGDEAATNKHIAELQGSLRQADAAVGIILDALAQTGLDQDTLVLFNTDHGVELPGGKWTMYDGGVGIAFVMRWPAGGVAGGRTCDWLLGNVDFLPTLAALTGITVPANLQGVSFAEGCLADVAAKPSPRPVVYSSWVDGLNYSVRTPTHKLIRNLVPIDSTGRVCPPYELYDLRTDPLELANVADQPTQAAVLGDLKGKMDAWLREMDDPIVHGPVEGATHNDMLADYRRKYEKLRGVATSRPAGSST